ncbi:universal stress protein [Nisaea sp.]|uniref:universal stress protein n=1 Tax=Nisaea sp. TaxID=2024842 RepID=UPI002B27753B|nr:universal stress protein [Nisaea sp.]
MYKSILLPIDLEHDSSWAKALPVALEMVQAFNGTLHLVSVVPKVGMPAISMYLPEDFETKALQHAAEHLHAFAVEKIPEGVRGQSHVAHGVIREEIAKAAEKLGCDLIIMAPHRPEMTDFLISPATSYVVSHTKRSVLVVR